MDAKHVSLEEMEEFDMVVNQCFQSEQDGYNYYNAFAKSKGFSIRRSTLRRKKDTKVIFWRRFCCSGEGYRELKYFEKTYQKREPRPLTRSGCLAKLEIEFSEGKGLWYVKNYVDRHDHPLAKPDQVAFLRSHRVLSDAQKAEAVELGVGGLRTSQIMGVMEKTHGGYDKVGFVSRDLYNFFARHKKKRIEGSDAEFVLNHMNAKQEEDAEFFFKYTVNDEGRLKNIFWADSQSRIDYSAFGGIVVFDSTYRVNRYNLPFVPFIGVNHHRSTIVFCCGIISDETVGSYVWLLETFLEAMRQKHPKSLITDGDIAMSKAIHMVMPETDHRLCSWHIEQNMIRHLRDPKLSKFRKFIYHAMEVDEFERSWVEFKERHGIKEKDLWICKMYELRNKWSAAHTKGRYFLGMRSNQRSESLNSRLHKHLDRRMSLVDLVEHYEFCLSRIRRNEAELDAKASQSVPFTRISADPLEKSAARIYTPIIFKKVRKDIKEQLEWQVVDVTQKDGVARYKISLKAKVQYWFHVSCTFDGSLLKSANCHCRKMECEDIPCAHIFTVVKYLGLDTIPRCLVMVRWTMEAKVAFDSDRNTNTHVWSDQMDRYRELRNLGNKALFKASKSTEQSERVMHFIRSILDEDLLNDGNTDVTSFGALPAHFSGSSVPSTNKVLDPVQIICKGAPNKRLKRFQESWKRKNY